MASEYCTVMNKHIIVQCLRSFFLGNIILTAIYKKYLIQSFSKLFQKWKVIFVTDIGATQSTWIVQIFLKILDSEHNETLWP